MAVVYAGLLAATHVCPVDAVAVDAAFVAMNGNFRE